MKPHEPSARCTGPWARLALSTSAVALTLASAWAVYSRALSVLEALKVMSFVATVLWPAMSGAKRGQVYTVLAVSGWLLRAAHTAHMTLWEQMPDKWQVLMTGGKGHLILLLSCVLDQGVVLSTLPRWLVDGLTILNALIFGRVVHRYLDPGVHWGRLLWLCVITPLAAAVGPAWAWRWWARAHKHASTGASQGTHPAPPPEKAAAASTSAAGPALAAACKGVSRSIKAPGLTAAGQGTARSGSKQVIIDWRAWQHTLGLGQAATKGSSPATLVQALKAAAYTRKLGLDHKVCIKLDTDMWYDQLPYEKLAAHMQGALHAMPGPSLHLTVMAARPGCVMITLQLTQAAGKVRDGTSMVVPEHLAQALLGQVLQAVDGSSDSAAGAAVVRRLQLQVDDYVAEASPHQPSSRRSGSGSGSSSSSSSWQLQPVQDLQPPARSASPASVASSSSSLSHAGSGEIMAAEQDGMFGGLSQPSLGLARLLPGQAAQTASPTGHVCPVVEVQLWGITKLDMLTGWAPPAPGLHAPEPAPAGPGPSSSNEFRLLARMPWGYAPTRVLGVRHTLGSQLLVAQVGLELSGAQLMQHHARGPINQVLCCSLELVTAREVLLATTPLLAALPAPPDARMSAWWWGAADRTVAAAVQEVADCTSALAEAAPAEAAAACVPPWQQFVSDLQLWLAEVQRLALSSGLCSSCSMSAQAELAPVRVLGQACLDPSSRHQLWEGLSEYAGSTGLAGVQAMLQQQMQRVVVPAEQRMMAQEQQQPEQASITGSSRCAGSVARSTPPSLVRLLRQVVWGHECSLCEEAYKQELQHTLAPLSRAGGLALAGFACILVANTAQARGLKYASQFVVYAALHLASVIAPYVPCTWLGAVSSSGGTCWAVYAYLWRLLMRVGNWLNSELTFQNGKVYRKPGAWLLTNMFIAAFEQVQSSMVLPSVRVAALAVFVDLPFTLLRGLQETPSPLLFLYAPLAVVMARVLLELWLRRAVACAPPPALHTPTCTSRLQRASSAGSAASWQPKSCKGE